MENIQPFGFRIMVRVVRGDGGPDGKGPALIGRRPDNSKICVFVREKLKELKEGEVWACILVQPKETVDVVDPIERLSGVPVERAEAPLPPLLAEILLKGITQQLEGIREEEEKLKVELELMNDKMRQLNDNKRFLEEAFKKYEAHKEAGANEENNLQDGGLEASPIYDEVAPMIQNGAERLKTL